MFIYVRLMHYFCQLFHHCIFVGYFSYALYKKRFVPLIQIMRSDHIYTQVCHDFTYLILADI